MDWPPTCKIPRKQTTSYTTDLVNWKNKAPGSSNARKKAPCLEANRRRRENKRLYAKPGAPLIKAPPAWVGFFRFRANQTARPRVYACDFKKGWESVIQEDKLIERAQDGDQEAFWECGGRMRRPISLSSRH